MSLEQLLNGLLNYSDLNQNDKNTLINNLQVFIDTQYIPKDQVIELQKKVNQLSSENNSIRHQVAVRFSRKEHQTIAFQLGKNIIDIFNGNKKISHLPVVGLNLFVEAMERKNKEDLTVFQKKIYNVLRYKKLLEQDNFKKGVVSALKEIVKQLDATEQQLSEKNPVDGQFVELKKENSLEIKKSSNSTEAQTPIAIVKSPHTQTENNQAKILQDTVLENNKKLKIACIMDEFTYFCFAPEADLLQLTPEHWLDEIVSFKPDILFIESAWQGKESLWKAKVSQNSTELVNLINYCKINKIKSLFWNKEDPVHFGTFIEVAKQVDVVFTTDIDCIGQYKAHVKHDHVYLMPFAAQPQTHNPIEKYQRKDAFNFAGSFYLKYPERQRDFVNLTAVATKFRKLDIYDRNFNKPHPHYTFPEQYQQYILGRLEPHEIDKAYKGYIYGINMNTIKQSQSMFARRVFEMLASNTIVLSNYSRGVRNFFGDLVLCSDNPQELERKLNQIVHDKNTVDKFKALGLRKVLAEHTYEDRIEYILEKLKIEAENNKYKVAVFAIVHTQKELQHILKMFKQQLYTDKVLFIYNPDQLKLINEEGVYELNNGEDLLSSLADKSIGYIAPLSVLDYYSAHYLVDMLLSFKYLKYQNIAVVTKDSFYDQFSNLQQGVEYQVVSQFKLNRAVLSVEYVQSHVENITHLIDNEQFVVKDSAFAIDRFNYIENVQLPSEQQLDLINTEMPYLDYGVQLKQRLLPFAEKIIAKRNNDEIVGIYDGNYFQQYVKTNHKLINIVENNQGFSLQSKLDKKTHRYVFLIKGLELSSNKICVELIGKAEIDNLVAVEFYNENKEKIAFKLFELNKLQEIEVPDNARSIDISVRLKGSGSISLTQLSYRTINETNPNESKIKNSSIISLLPTDFEQYLVKPTSKQIQFDKNDDQFVIKTTLAPTKHAYMYMRKIYTREELNLVLNSEFELKAATTAEDVRIVFEFQDENQVKISHSMNSIVGGHALAIPMHCKYIRIGFKVVGTGLTTIKSLDIGVVKNQINDFIAKSRILVVAKQYPSYHDLYKYGFLHTRLKAYKKEDQLTDMFKVTTVADQFGFSEFEGVDIFSHDHEMLDRLLASGTYSRVCVHLIDKKIWDVLKKYQDTVQILVWVHGAEIQVWQRREFEFERMSGQEIERQKKLSNQRRNFWRDLVQKELKNRTQFIFVSQYFLEESEADLGIKFPKNQCHIIHNYIDTDFFNYVEKPASQRFKLLSIRPFASRKYANDLTVKTIEELAKKPGFNKFDIAIYGDGPLFDEITQPLQKFGNVSLNKTFLNHSQIAALHKEYGVFIVPTRMDSQGVSRDEAMSSGLVPVTTAVTAIPEFVDDECGILVAGEDYTAMANGIYSLTKDYKKYKKLSAHASKRVINQCGFDETIGKELKLF
ncbi:glycosyltransferase family protein [Acinetobacter larvae]|uniref:Spore protein YkvP/CgeB glycosyl transferase-like domain-containing protein n=1 Tax=Acinetobacter larvae TaxID=1789224 RepID=A0A1B2M1Z7_9GAMM|nr:glycosyltransferase [Acinetobacter larvae]AOA59208.2 hypothetical protein BFG52_13145 [Acinetobacter larvae]